jgi:predicted lipoprotein with Yx(FWY)xxD motif
MVGAVGLALLTAALLRFARPPPASERIPAGAAAVPQLTPPGITLQVRTSTDKTRIDAPAQEYYAAADGMALYVQSGDQSGREPACVGACPERWRILQAPQGAIADGDWSLFKSASGPQWRFRGRPVYRDVNDTVIGTAEGDGADEGGWQVALLRPEGGMALPDGISVRSIADAGGMGLVDDRGLTLYADETGRAATSCDAACQRLWHPLEAAAIANPIGEFRPLARSDGVTQWTYRQRPLYTYEADHVPGDALGLGVAAAFKVALTARFFTPANVMIRRTLEFGTVLATTGGYTLYQRDRVTAGEERHEFRTDHGTPALGRTLGLSTCDAACTRDWPPLAAPADAEPSGYWTVLIRPDGSHQWAYKGFALYTYAADRPGELGGSRLYTFAPINAAAPLKTSAPLGAASAAAPAVPPIDPFAPPGTAPGAGVGALFWHAVVP